MGAGLRPASMGPLAPASVPAPSFPTRAANSARPTPVRIEETFGVDRPPEAVFDYMTDPANLAQWQTTKTYVEPLTDGPLGLGSRFRERTKPPGGREFEMVTEFTEFDRPRRFHVHVLEGPQLIDGTWSLEPDGGGTRVRFVAEGELRGALRWVEPVARRVMARQFAKYHRLLRVHLERGR
jgi:uncharacterized protein YndB with AHSA1/START domain